MRRGLDVASTGAVELLLELRAYGRLAGFFALLYLVFALPRCSAGLTMMMMRYIFREPKYRSKRSIHKSKQKSRPALTCLHLSCFAPPPGSARNPSVWPVGRGWQADDVPSSPAVRRFLSALLRAVLRTCKSLLLLVSANSVSIRC